MKRFVVDMKLVYGVNTPCILDLKLSRVHVRHDWSMSDIDSFVNHMNKSLESHIRPVVESELVAKMRSNW